MNDYEVGSTYYYVSRLANCKRQVVEVKCTGKKAYSYGFDFCFVGDNYISLELSSGDTKIVFHTKKEAYEEELKYYSKKANDAQREMYDFIQKVHDCKRIIKQL